MDQATQMTLTFRCLPGLENILPRPIPAVQGLPEWFKSMPAKAFDLTMGSETETVKRCPPFIDAMTYGFLFRWRRTSRSAMASSAGISHLRDFPANFRIRR